jgi:hypothetical protein
MIANLVYLFTLPYSLYPQHAEEQLISAKQVSGGIMSIVLNMVLIKGDRQRQIRNRIRRKWSNLSDREVALYENQREVFFKAVQKKYGLTKSQIKRTLCEIGERPHEAA